MKRALRRVGMLLAIAGSVVFVGYVLSTLQLAQLREHLNARSFLALGAATLLYSTIVPLSALAWQRMLAAMGHRERFLPLTAILLTTQAGKYLPGNVGQHIGRIGLSLAQGIPAALLVASMAYEICLLLLADLLTALGAGASSGPGLALLLQGSGDHAAMVVAATVAVLGIAAIPLLSKVLPPLTAWLMRKRGTAIHAAPAPLGMRTMVEVVALYVAAMLFVGAGLTVLANGLFPAHAHDFALLTAAFTIAWAIGFVTPGAPAGLGVREALLLLMLTRPLGVADASLLIIALRVATTLGDMLCFAVGLALMPMLRRAGNGMRPAVAPASTAPAAPPSDRNPPHAP